MVINLLEAGLTRVFDQVVGQSKPEWMSSR